IMDGGASRVRRRAAECAQMVGVEVVTGSSFLARRDGSARVMRVCLAAVTTSAFEVLIELSGGRVDPVVGRVALGRVRDFRGTMVGITGLVARLTDTAAAGTPVGVVAIWATPKAGTTTSSV